MNLKGLYCCPCGEETECDWMDLNIGQVFQCPTCKVVMACVYPQGGGRAWITVDPKEVEFYSLIEENR